MESASQPDDEEHDSWYEESLVTCGYPDDGEHQSDDEHASRTRLRLVHLGPPSSVGVQDTIGHDIGAYWVRRSPDA